MEPVAGILVGLACHDPGPESTMAIRLVRSIGRDITQTSLWGTYGVTQRS
jgi:hypothetical protein